MRVKMTESVQGRVADVHWSPKAGDEIEVSDEHGARLCDRGYAVPVVTEPASVETRPARAPKAELRNPAPAKKAAAPKHKRAPRKPKTGA